MKEKIVAMTVTLATLAVALPLTAVAGGSIRSITAYNLETGEDEYDPVNLIRIGDSFAFKVRLLNYNDELSPAGGFENYWNLSIRSGVDSTTAAENPPQLGLWMGGQTRFAMLKSVVPSDNGYYTDLIFEYTVQAGDMAFPVKFCDASGTGELLNSAGQQYLLQNVGPSSCWELTDGSGHECQFEFGPQNLMPSSTDHYAYPPRGWSAAYEVRDYDLSWARICVQTVDFDQVSTPVWRTVYEKKTTTADGNGLPALTIPGGATATSTFYLWTEDSDVAVLANGGETTYHSLDHAGNPKDYIVYRADIVNQETFPFRIKGGAGKAGQSTTIYLSTTPTNIYNTAGTLITNFVWRTIAVTNYDLSADVMLNAGEYFRATLTELGYDVPTNGTAYSVKAYGLPVGLKLKFNAAVTKRVKVKGKWKKIVVKPAKCEWWIEGVPTAALDYATNPPYLVITTNGVAQTLPLSMGVEEQEVTPLGELVLGDSLNEQFYLPGVTNGWTVSGLPPGLKYTSKLLTKKKKKGKKVVSITTNALPYSVYGKTTKAGLFTITAKRKVNAQAVRSTSGTGGSPVYYETMKYQVLVTPRDDVDKALFGDLMNITTMAYVPFEWNLTNDVSSVSGKVAKVTGLPKGLTFAAANVYAYKNAKKKTGKYLKQSAQTIVGTPTKPGTYVVTFTKNVMTGTDKKKKTVAKTAQILWKVVANDAEVELDFNTEGAVIEGGVVGLKYGDLLAFTATSNAVVKASGLPKGIALVDLGGGNYAFTGFTTKAGTYLVTVKATLNGNTVTQRLALKVEGLPDWAKGTFNGYVRGSGTLAASGGEGSGESAASPRGLATITVSSVGKISGKFYEGGTNWTLSAVSYTAATSAAAPGGGDPAAPALTCSNVVAKYTYKAKEKVKGKLKTVTKSVTRAFAFTVAPVPIVPNVPIVSNVPDVPIRGVAQMVEDGEAGTTITAYQNIWGRSAYKAVGQRLFYTSKKKPYKTFTCGVYTNETGNVCFVKDGDDTTGLAYFAALSLKVTPKGAVTATLTYDTGKKTTDKKTKKKVPVYYKPTCATVVIPTSAVDDDPFTGEAFLFFAPSAGNNFPGLGGWVPF